MIRSNVLEEPHLYNPRSEDISEGEGKKMKRYIFGRKKVEFSEYEEAKLKKFKTQVINYLKKFNFPNLLQSFKKYQTL